VGSLARPQKVGLLLLLLLLPGLVQKYRLAVRSEGNIAEYVFQVERRGISSRRDSLLSLRRQVSGSEDGGREVLLLLMRHGDLRKRYMGSACCDAALQRRLKTSTKDSESLNAASCKNKQRIGEQRCYYWAKRS